MAIDQRCQRDAPDRDQRFCRPAQRGRAIALVKLGRMRAASMGLEYRAAGYVAAPVILRALSPVWPAAPVRRAGIGDQVVLENLDRTEACCCNGFQFIMDVAGDADGRDRGFHRCTLVADVCERPEALGRGGGVAEEFEIGRDHLEQHVDADLHLAAPGAGRGEKGRHFLLHHHLADETAR